MREYLAAPAEQPRRQLHATRRQSSRPLLAQTASEQIEVANPMRFFSILNEIEERISREALAAYASRQWQGILGEEDWQDAEDRLVDRPPVRIRIDGDVLDLRIDAREYAPQDVAIHMEGDLLCICALRESTHQGNARMFFTKVRIPACFRGTELAASKENGFLSIRLGIVSAAKTVHGIRRMRENLSERSTKVA